MTCCPPQHVPPESVFTGGSSIAADITEKASNKMRAIVSRQKKRYTYGNYDLDLSCIRLPREGGGGGGSTVRAGVIHWGGRAALRGGMRQHTGGGGGVGQWQHNVTLCHEVVVKHALTAQMSPTAL